MSNPMTDFCKRAIDRGFKGFVLLVRTPTGLEQIDEYAASPHVADLIYRDAVANAQGLAEPFAAFVCRAEGQEGGSGPTRAFSVNRGPSPHQVDRYDSSQTSVVRMLLEHIDKQNHVITGVLPQNVAASSQMVSALSGHLTNITNTHGEAVTVLREGKIETLTAEKALMEQAERSERVNKLIDLGLQLLPALIQKAPL